MTFQERNKEKRYINILFPYVGSYESTLNAIAEEVLFPGGRLDKITQIDVDLLALDIEAEEYLQHYIIQKSALLHERENLLFHKEKSSGQQ